MPLPPQRAAQIGRARWLVLCLLGALLACEPRSDADSQSAAERTAQRLGLSVKPLPAPLPRPSFSLTDTDGNPFDFQQATSGRLTLLFFGYTHCPDICPGHLTSLAAGLRGLPPELRDQVLVVFVGVDAERDTRERVRDWLDHFDPSFVGLTGTEAELAAAQRAALVPTASVEDRWEDGYSVAHASWILVYTPDDQAHLRYGFGTTATQWSHDLERLAREGWPAA